MTARWLGFLSRSVALVGGAILVSALSGCGPGADAEPGSDAGTGTGGSTTPSSSGGSSVTGSGGASVTSGGAPGTAGPGGAAPSSGGARATGGANASGGAPANGSGGARTGGAGPATGGAGVGGAGGNITIWISGDSTVANGSAPCPIGWGGQFLPHFDARVSVVNRAIAGRSVQTWLYDVSATLGGNGECTLNSTTFLPAWADMLNATSGMKTGDYLFIQFGINDTDATCPRHVGTALFQTYYGMMAQAARARGANPIFVTPVSSISCSGATARGSRGTFSAATKTAGTTYNVPVIDLEALSVGLYNSLGFCPLPGPDAAATFEAGAIGAFFCEDHTHFEMAGAIQIGNLVATALRTQNIGLAAYLK